MKATEGNNYHGNRKWCEGRNPVANPKIPFRQLQLPIPCTLIPLLCSLSNEGRARSEMRHLSLLREIILESKILVLRMPTFAVKQTELPFIYWRCWYVHSFQQSVGISTTSLMSCRFLDFVKLSWSLGDRLFTSFYLSQGAGVFHLILGIALQPTTVSIDLQHAGIEEGVKKK